MKPVTFALPSNATLVSNILIDSKEPAFLTEDLVLIELPSSTFIDVSWKSELEPNGAYIITVYRCSWDNQLEQLETRNVMEVVRWVETLADDYCRPIRSVSALMVDS